MDSPNPTKNIPLPHEYTPLEAAIQRYSDLANKHYNSQLQLAKTRENKDTINTKLKADIEHLNSELARAEKAAEVQSLLEEYRTIGKQATQGDREERVHKQKILANEQHHPTTILSKLMRIAGKAQPSKAHTAHHIVPGVGKTLQATRARTHIHRYGIRINDPDNGIWLVRKKDDTPHWSMPNSKNHLSIHTKNYETWVYESVRVIRNEQILRKKLELLGLLLQQGKQPAKVTMPPDENWNGK